MSWRRGVVAVAVVLPFIALLAFGLTRDPRELPSTLPGRPAPAFALEVMTPPAPLPPRFPQAGDTVRLAAHRGQVVVLNYWASWCLACREEHATLSSVAEAYYERGVRFYGILYQDTPANARRFIIDMAGQSYPTLLDPGARTAIDYGLFGVPETFFISPDGRVSYKHVGPVTQALLVEKIEGLLARAPETTPEGAS